jgi:hypothetical protein
MLARGDSGLVQQVDDFAGEPLELVVEVVGEEIDALVGALDAAPHFVEMGGLLMPVLVELLAHLAEELLELLIERGLALEVVDDLEEDEEDGAEGGGIDEPVGEMRGVGGGEVLREEARVEGVAPEAADEGRERFRGPGKRFYIEIGAHHLVPSLGGCSRGRDGLGAGAEVGRGAVVELGGGAGAAGGADAKELSALGGKVSGAGAGVEPEKGEAVEAGLESVQLFSVGDGNVDKDAVLQAGKAQIERLEAVSQEIVLEIFDIGGGLVDGGIEPPGLGLVQEIIDQMQQLAGGVRDFGDHLVSFLYGVLR